MAKKSQAVVMFAAVALGAPQGTVQPVNIVKVAQEVIAEGRDESPLAFKVILASEWIKSHQHPNTMRRDNGIKWDLMFKRFDEENRINLSQVAEEKSARSAIEEALLEIQGAVSEEHARPSDIARYWKEAARDSAASPAEIAEYLATGDVDVSEAIELEGIVEMFEDFAGAIPPEEDLVELGMRAKEMRHNPHNVQLTNG